jgi:NAD+ kinase
VASPKFAFAASSSLDGQGAIKALEEKYGHHDLEDADVIVALGGDGFVLQTLHRHMKNPKKIYGMNRGSIGFLLNDYDEDQLAERLERAETVTLHPLRMRATLTAGPEQEGLAINEVSLLRQSGQAAKLRISIDGKVRIDELICDGCMVSTPAGSTAYNMSAHGPILPIGSDVLALTPVSAFRPRRWRGAILPRTARIKFEMLDLHKRPVSAVADAMEVRNIAEVEIWEDREIALQLMFDEGSSLGERILKEQFTV